MRMSLERSVILESEETFCVFRVPEGLRSFDKSKGGLTGGKRSRIQFG
jgi:hypothetical protein